MIHKALKTISIEDIQGLIDNSVAESKTIEYKESIRLDSESDKKEFLFDISSFANASGGDLIFGMNEDKDTGFPMAITGIAVNIDQLQLRIDSIIRDGISPRITGLNFLSVTISANRFVLIIRIPKSWNGPHQITYKGVDRFYSRSNNGEI